MKNRTDLVIAVIAAAGAVLAAAMPSLLWKPEEEEEDDIPPPVDAGECRPGHGGHQIRSLPIRLGHGGWGAVVPHPVEAGAHLWMLNPTGDWPAIVVSVVSCHNGVSVVWVRKDRRV